jgi:hypothetical protein
MAAGGMPRRTAAIVAAMNAGPPDDARADLIAAVGELAAGLSADDQRALLDRFLAAAPFGARATAPRPSRRRPRRADVVTYRVRVDLDGAAPPLWRRLELASDLHLDEVHDVLQAAIGWTDSHLHEFAAGPSRHAPDSERYLCPYSAEDEPDAGVPAHEVRLDEVLVEPGDRLFYTYDFGDDWAHTLRLEAVEARTPDAPRARCTAGRRDGPPEDCGGVHGYELAVAAIDPTHPDHAEALAEHAAQYGAEVDPAAHPLVPFDMDEVNALLDHLGYGSAAATRRQPAGGERTPLGELGELLGRVRTGPVRRRLRALVAAARLDEPPLVDAGVAAEMVRPYAVLLDHLGEEGVKLTQAGYLPPALVRTLFDELGLAEEWVGAVSREDLTGPVLSLRETAQATGLVRKHRGRLLPTARGRSLRADPLGLWRHLAERMPPVTGDEAERTAGVLTLLAVAAGAGEEAAALTAAVLTDLGWRHGDRSPLTEAAGAQLTWECRAMLRRLGALARDDATRQERATPRGVAIARAALQASQPGGVQQA